MIRRCLLLAVILLPASCGSLPPEPMSRPGTWRAAGNNDSNLRAMLANPRDLVQGRSSDNALGAEASAPVTRVLTGSRYALPIEGSAEIGIRSSNPTSAGGPADRVQ